MSHRFIRAWVGSFSLQQESGLSKLGMNAIRMPPNWEHYPEHYHVQTTRRKLDVPLEGKREKH